jgi:hypothetical protein
LALYGRLVDLYFRVTGVRQVSYTETMVYQGLHS